MRQLLWGTLDSDHNSLKYILSVTKQHGQKLLNLSSIVFVINVTEYIPNYKFQTIYDVQTESWNEYDIYEFFKRNVLKSGPESIYQLTAMRYKFTDLLAKIHSSSFRFRCGLFSTANILYVWTERIKIQHHYSSPCHTLHCPPRPCHNKKHAIIYLLFHWKVNYLRLFHLEVTNRVHKLFWQLLCLENAKTSSNKDFPAEVRWLVSWLSFQVQGIPLNTILLKVIKIIHWDQILISRKCCWQTRIKEIEVN